MAGVSYHVCMERAFLQRKVVRVPSISEYQSFKLLVLFLQYSRAFGTRGTRKYYVISASAQYFPRVICKSFMSYHTLSGPMKGVQGDFVF